MGWTGAELREIARFGRNPPDHVNEIEVDDDGLLTVEAWVEALGQYVTFANDGRAKLLQLSGWYLKDDELAHPNLDGVVFCCVGEYETLDEVVLGLVQLMAFPNWGDPADTNIDEDEYAAQFVDYDPPAALDRSTVHDDDLSA